MKKKILFVMNSLKIGGAEKSLLTILDLIDYEKYDVDLFLLGHEGEFFKQLNSKVNLLNEDRDFKLFEKNKSKAPLLFLKQKKFKKSLNSLKYQIGYFVNKIIKRKKIYFGWKYVKNIIEKNNKEYDTVIGFMERYSMYYAATNTKADNKIVFIHNDFTKYYYDKKNDKKYFSYFNHIVTVSDHCKDVLEHIFSEYKNRYLVIKNMISKDLITRLANEKINIKKERNITYLCSVGRLTKQKGFDIAIDICDLLVNKYNLQIKWFIVGDGEEKNNLQNKITLLKLQDKIILVGSDINPYKWMNIADIYIQPSRYEGYGITVAEAKALNKPIIASDIPEFRELLGNNKENLAKTIDEYASKIDYLIKNNNYKIQEYKDSNNINELNKLYKII